MSKQPVRNPQPSKVASKKSPGLKVKKRLPQERQIEVQPFILRVPSIVSQYNRDAALAFARKYWTRVCPDSHIGITSSPHIRQVPPGTVFERVSGGGGFTEVAKLPNGTTIPFAELEDCAHFVSNCLGTPPGGQTAGGLKIASEFASVYGLLGANKLYEHLTNEGLIKTVNKDLTEQQASSKLGSLSSGDLIFYRPKSNSAYRHVGIYLADKQRIACHTYCRADVVDTHPQGWNSVGFSLPGGGADVTYYTLAVVL